MNAQSSELRHVAEAVVSSGDLSDQRALFRDVTTRIAAYRRSGREPPTALEWQRRELLAHFAAVSQGR